MTRSDELGDADVTVGGLRMWIHGWQFPDSDDFWDGNWLLATVVCMSDASRVVAKGPIIRRDELRSWREELLAMHAKVAGRAELKCLEPELHVAMDTDVAGHTSVEVSITPNVMNEKHEFRFDLDQSYLPAIASSLAKVLERYPSRGSRNDAR